MRARWRAAFSREPRMRFAMSSRSGSGGAATSCAHVLAVHSRCACWCASVCSETVCMR